MYVTEEIMNKKGTFTSREDMLNGIEEILNKEN
jgi:hypothetical protein